MMPTEIDREKELLTERIVKTLAILSDVDKEKAVYYLEGMAAATTQPPRATA